MFNAHTAVVLDTFGTESRFGRIPIQAVSPKMITFGPTHKLISIFTALHHTLDFMLRLL